MNRSNLARHKSLSGSLHADIDIHMMSTAVNTEPNTSDSNESSEPDDDQVAMMSESQGSNGSQHLETPTRRRRRRVGRKNLSHSFSSFAFPKNDEEIATTIKDDVLQPLCYQELEQKFDEQSQNTETEALSKTDSGFNDMEEWLGKRIANSAKSLQCVQNNDHDIKKSS